MKKILILILSIFMLSACTSNESNNEDVLRVGMELAYPPFETKDEAGNPIGVSVDIAKDLGEYLGKEVIIENIDWAGLIPSLKTGAVDVVISSMTITEERKETINFSDPYAKSYLALLTNTEAGIESIEDLDQEGNTLAVKSGSTGHIYAEKNIKNAEVIVLADESAAVTEVILGNADAFIYDQLTIYRNWQRNLETTTPIFIPFQDVEMWGIGVDKENTELLEQVNAFLAEYISSGGLAETSQKYLLEEEKTFDELGFEWFFDLN